MIAPLVHRYLDPTDSLGEVLFGLIMALTFTLGASVVAQSTGIDQRELVVAVLGCNLAWGIIDGVLYLIGTSFNRNRRVQFVRRLRQTSGQAEAMAAIREEFSLEDEPELTEADREAFHRVMLDIMSHAPTERLRLRANDYIAAAVIAVLVTLTSVPGVVPFFLIEDDYLALRAANVIQIGLLFIVGFRWARHTGSNPWRAGGMIVALCVGLVVVSVVLGG